MLAIQRLSIFALAVASLATAAAQLPAPPAPSPGTGTVLLDPCLTSGALWQSTDADLHAAALPFRWVSQTHDAARAASPALRLADLPVAEVIARFTAAPDGKPLTGIQISIYNRGDAGDLDAKGFDALVARSKAALAELTKAAPADRGADSASAVQSRGVVYQTAQSRFLLEWSATAENKVQGVPYRAEFVRLRVSPAPTQPKGFLDQLRAQAASGSSRPLTVRASELPARVIKEPDGAARLPGIPMVDQGQKGYCVTASVERVLRYYGVEVDQNELAQIANTATAGGTSTDAMLAALKKLASRFRVNVVTEVNPTYADFMREIDDYNRVARNAPKTAGIKPVDAGVTAPGGLSLEAVFAQMNGEVLRDARTKINAGPATRFEREVQLRLDRGIPLLWSVTLGLLPEEKVTPQMRGGHMRLIIGYNARTHDIFYSDSWGFGHELKRMPVANAWTITTGLFTLEPI